MRYRNTIRSLAIAVTLAIGAMCVDDVMAQRRGGGHRGSSSSRSTGGRRASSVRHGSQGYQSSRTRQSTNRGRRASRGYDRPGRPASGYGSVRHASRYYGGNARSVGTGGRPWTPQPGAGGLTRSRAVDSARQTARGNRVGVGKGNTSRNRSGVASHLDGRSGRDASIVRGPHRGAARIEGRHGREAAVVWGPRGAVVAGRGPHGGFVGGAGRYVRGGVAVVRPNDHTSIVIGGHTYYGWGGHCYRRVYYNGELCYVGIRPPVSWFISVLPHDCETIIYNDITYYHYDDLYYIQQGQGEDAGFVVAEPPAGLADLTNETATKGQNPFAILKRMSDFLGQVPRFSVRVSDTADEASESGPMIQIATDRTIRVSRPDRLQVDVSGDRAERRIVYDGRAVTWHDMRQKTYGTLETPGTLDEMLDFLAEQYGATIPIADLFYRDSYNTMIPASETGRYIGHQAVGGTDCHHLAFEGGVIDWQIWIDAGEQPLPRKLVITYKLTNGSPRYRATLQDWNLAPEFSGRQFEFQPPLDATRLDVLPVAGSGSSSS